MGGREGRSNTLVQLGNGRGEEGVEGELTVRQAVFHLIPASVSSDSQNIFLLILSVSTKLSFLSGSTDSL